MRRAAAATIVVLFLTGLVSVRAAVLSNNAIRDARSAVAQVKADLLSQTSNRSHNVFVWCHAINHDRRVLVAYVDNARRQNRQVPALNLPALPCSRLATATSRSATSK